MVVDVSHGSLDQGSLCSILVKGAVAMILSFSAFKSILFRVMQGQGMDDEDDDEGDNDKDDDNNSEAFGRPAA
jgi:hypothetical protein